MKKTTRAVLAAVAVAVLGLVACPPTAPLAADFTFSPARPVVGQLVRFYDRSTGNPVAWAWTIGGDFASTGRNPTHTFTEAGSYLVSMTVEAAGHTQRSATKTVIVAIAPLPAPNFSYLPDFLEAETEIAFTDTTAGTPPARAWLWEFGDGVTSTLQNPRHTYAADGTYQLRFTATNAYGSGSVTRPMVVAVALVANFTWSPTVPASGQEVQFIDTSTGVGIVSWLWEFGDGATSTLQNPKHTFTNTTDLNKEFIVTLTVTNSHGLSASSRGRA